MSDRSAIDRSITTIVDRGGRRIRTYLRKDPNRPGQQERRRRVARGERWCRGCRDWLPAAVVTRQGACCSCVNREWRDRYAGDPARIRSRVHARKRGVDPVPILGAELLLEQFDRRCAYCSAAATTWDHIVPVARGGKTEAGNIVPACPSCNSSKKASSLASWLERTERVPNPTLWDVLALDPLAVE